MNIYPMANPSAFREMVKKDVRSVANEFEAIMLKEILKTAYRPLIKNKSFYQQMYYDMFLEKVSDQMAQAGGVGIAKFIVDNFYKGKEEKLKEMVEREVARSGLPRWVAKIPEIESGYDPKAVSPKGAAGLWQLLPETARSFGLKVEGDIDERFDPVKSTKAALRYINYLKDKFGDWIKVVVAYNWGEGNLMRLGDFNPDRDMDKLPKETRNYVTKLIKLIEEDSSLR